MPMIKRDLPTAYRRRGKNLTATIVHQTPEDATHLEAVRTHIAERHGFNVSSAVVMAMALEALHMDVQSGNLRTSPEAHVNVPKRVAK
jgi:hypothetical protein